MENTSFQFQFRNGSTATMAWFLSAGVSLAALLSAYLLAGPHAELLLEPLAQAGIRIFERNQLPDFLSRPGVRLLLRHQLSVKNVAEAGSEDGSEAQRNYVRSFIADLKQRPIAEQQPIANEQHYEVDTRFYNLVLGKHRKYSSALYPDPAKTTAGDALGLLDDAEERMLKLYAERAQITDGKRLRVMDLGCGWGSVTLWFAARFPGCDFVGFSNSKTQRQYILQQAKERGLTNVDVLTGDIAQFELPVGIEPFDRVISVEMFEHMKNYEKVSLRGEQMTDGRGQGCQQALSSTAVAARE